MASTPQASFSLTSPAPTSWRWLAVSVFVISSTLNYLDRALLNVLATLIMAEMHFNQTGFGWLISAFSIAYAIAPIATGWFLDRVGINIGISTAVSWWSAAAVSTGLVRSLPGLAICRAALGIGESAGVPAVGKLNGMYLKPEERALGTAVNQIGLSLGSIIAPLFVGVALAYSWRFPFVLTGLAGFVWIPVWLLLSKKIKPEYQASTPAREHSGFAILLDRPLLLLVAANVLWMGSYSLWSNWIPLYLQHVHHLTLKQAAHYVWIPPLISNLGGFLGGWLSLRWIRRGQEAIPARRKAVWVSAVGALVTLALPFAPTAAWATAVISLSFFFALSGSVNIYAMPIDVYGPARAGMAVAALTCAYGILQTLISPVIGWLGDHQLYNQVVWLVTVPLLLSPIVLEFVRSEYP